MAIKYLAFFRKQFCSKQHHIYHAWIFFDVTGNKLLHFFRAIGVYQKPHRNNLQIKKIYILKQLKEKVAKRSLNRIIRE